MVRLEPMVIQKLCVMNMSQCNNELISVVMGVFYQKEDLYLLETSIKSIINQTYRNFEFLICENGSSYDAKQILKKYSKIDKRIKLIDGVGANSLSEKLNRCIKVSKGKYIARQDDDDYSKPDRFKAQLEYLKNNQDISFVGCSVEIKQDRKVLGVRYFPENPEIKDFLFVQPFIHPTLMFRKECLYSVGLYCEESRCNGCEDYDLLLRLYQNNYLGSNLKKPYFIYTVYANSSGNRNLSMRINEVKTRFIRFKSLGLLPKSLPYIVKPIIVGLIPYFFLKKLKSIRNDTSIK